MLINHIMKTGLIPENNNATVTLSYPIGGQNLPNRLVFGDVILYASQESIRVTFDDTEIDRSKEKLHNCKTHALRILELLHHTPINALGVNFAFEEDSMNQLDKVSDVISPLLDMGIDDLEDPESIDLKRVLKPDFCSSLNHRLMKNSDDTVVFDFNYHYEAVDAKACIDLLKSDLVDLCFDNAKKIMGDAYDVEI